MNDNYMFSRLFVLSTCLIASTVARSAIIGGDTVKIDQFPYQVAIIDPEEGLVCGGGIISQIHVLTAANCVINENGHFRGAHIRVLAGTDDTLRRLHPTVNLAVAKIYVPSSFTPLLLTTTADIAVLKLEKTFRFSRYVRKLELPKHKTQAYIHETAVITGYGLNWVWVDHHKVIPVDINTQLRYAEADILINGQHGYPESRKITEHHLLAKIKQRDSEQHSTCLGDGGGPLVLRGTSLVIGILSVSPKGCSEADRPSIYTRVSHYLDFINDALIDKTSDTMRTHVLIP